MYEMQFPGGFKRFFKVIYWCAQMVSSDLHLMGGIANLARNMTCYNLKKNMQFSLAYPMIGNYLGDKCHLPSVIESIACKIINRHLVTRLKVSSWVWKLQKNLFILKAKAFDPPQQSPNAEEF